MIEAISVMPPRTCFFLSAFSSLGRNKFKGGGWETQASSLEDCKPHIKEIMDSDVKRCANSLVGEKDFSIVWHYRNVNPEQGKLRSLQLVAELNEYTHGLGLQVMMGNKIVEVRKQGIDKGKAVKKILRKSDYDFILAAGDDSTDEDMFKELSDIGHAHIIKIGSDASYATYNLHFTYDDFNAGGLKQFALSYRCLSMMILCVPTTIPAIPPKK